MAITCETEIITTQFQFLPKNESRGGLQAGDDENTLQNC